MNHAAAEETFTHSHPSWSSDILYHLPVKSTVDYIMVRQEDKAKVRNVKVISSEECVRKHKLLVMDMWFKATKTWHRKFEPRVNVWKLKEEKTCEEYRCIVGDKVQEAKWRGLGVNDHWQQMKVIMMETAHDICGMTKGPCRHKETWWWNEDVAEAVREKKITYGKQKKKTRNMTLSEIFEWQSRWSKKDRI